MRLLFFLHSLSLGGAERATSALANVWASRGHVVAVVTIASVNGDAYSLDPRVFRVSLDLAKDSRNAFVGLWHNWQRVHALRRILREFRPDIAQSMMTMANVLLSLASWRLDDIATIGSERIHPPRMALGFFWERLRSLSYGGLDAVVALTSAGAQWLTVHTSASKTCVIPNAVAWPLKKEQPEISAERYVPFGASMVLAVGRLARQKGFDLLIESFSRLSNRHPQWHLVIVGDGPERSSLAEQISAARLDERAHLTGSVGNVGTWYERADLYVMASRFEGFPNALLEALAYGVPAVSFDCETGPSDVVRQGIDGILVPPENVTGLTRAMDRLMGDEELRRRYAWRAVEVRERFSMDRVASLWEALFEELQRERG